MDAGAWSSSEGRSRLSSSVAGSSSDLDKSASLVSLNSLGIVSFMSRAAESVSKSEFGLSNEGRSRSSREVSDF